MDSVGEELERLARLRAAGDLSDEEYGTLKARLIDAPQVVSPTQEEAELPPTSTPKPEELKKDLSVRLPAIRFASWVLLSFNALMGLFVAAAFIATTTEACDGLTGDDLELCQGATLIGASIGVSLIFIIWAVVDMILITVWIATRSEPPKVPGTVSRVLGLGLFLVALALGISGVVGANSEREVDSTSNRSPVATITALPATTRTPGWVAVPSSVTEVVCKAYPKVRLRNTTNQTGTFRIEVSVTNLDGEKNYLVGYIDLRPGKTASWNALAPGFPKFRTGARCKVDVERGPLGGTHD